MLVFFENEKNLTKEIRAITNINEKSNRTKNFKFFFTRKKFYSAFVILVFPYKNRNTKEIKIIVLTFQAMVKDINRNKKSIANRLLINEIATRNKTACCSEKPR